MKTFKFYQLSDKAKVQAVYGYRQKLINNRDFSDDVDDLPDIMECFDICLDSDSQYSKEGKCLNNENED